MNIFNCKNKPSHKNIIYIVRSKMNTQKYYKKTRLSRSASHYHEINVNLSLFFIDKLFSLPLRTPQIYKKSSRLAGIFLPNRKSQLIEYVRFALFSVIDTKIIALYLPALVVYRISPHGHFEQAHQAHTHTHRLRFRLPKANYECVFYMFVVQTQILTVCWC